MGKRFWFGILLFLILPLCGGIACRYLYSTQISLHETMQQVAQTLDEEETKDVSATVENAIAFWKEHQKAVSALSSHSVPEQVRQDISRLRSQLATGEYSHAAETCRELSVLFHSLARDQLPLWWNFF